MKKLNQYIQEKFEINKNTRSTYKYFPETKEELRKILEERLKKDKNADLNDIDVSRITDMGSLDNDVYFDIGLFEYLDPHNIDISHWNVSNVTNMKYMFDECENFNCNLNKWDVSKVKNMTCMFYGCSKFNSDLNDWKVKNTTDTDGMFDYSPLEKNPPKWYKD